MGQALASRQTRLAEALREHLVRDVIDIVCAYATEAIIYQNRRWDEWLVAFNIEDSSHRIVSSVPIAFQLKWRPAEWLCSMPRIALVNCRDQVWVMRYGGWTGRLLCYSPKLRAWTHQSELPVSIGAQNAESLSLTASGASLYGLIEAFDGIDGTSLFSYNVDSRQWHREKMPGGRPSIHATIVASQAELYWVGIGTSTVFAFSFASRSWRELPAPPSTSTFRSSHAQVVNSELVLWSWFCWAGQVYSPTSDTWARFESPGPDASIRQDRLAWILSGSIAAKDTLFYAVYASIDSSTALRIWRRSKDGSWSELEQTGFRDKLSFNSDYRHCMVLE